MFQFFLSTLAGILLPFALAQTQMNASAKKCQDKIDQVCAPLKNDSAILACAWMKAEIFEKSCQDYIGETMDLRIENAIFGHDCFINKKNTSDLECKQFPQKLLKMQNNFAKKWMEK